MKRLATLISVLFLASALPCIGQRLSIRDEVRQDPMLCLGPDMQYSFDVPVPTPAPEGFEPVYIAHYGRHGSRYAYSPKTYSFLQEALEEGGRTGNLTSYGQELQEDLAPLFEAVKYRVGDLTRKGWDQLAGIAGVMLNSFPTAFPAGAPVDACSSPSVRSILSMTSFCLALAKERPDLDIYEHQSTMDLPACRPNSGNPFAYKSIAPECPCQETPESFILRSVDWKTVLGRMFKDPEAALGEQDPAHALDYLFMLVAGMASLDDGLARDLSGIFTPEEFASMWEADNYLRFREYYEYLATCCSIYDDIASKADAHLLSGVRGADLRFGHDHVILTLMMIADIDGIGQFARRPEDVATRFQNFNSPMGANIQMVFYQEAGQGCQPGEKTLVKLLLNGAEARFGELEAAEGPYYDWNCLKTYLEGRMDMFREKP